MKEIREARGISAAELARIAGISRQTVYAIEDGSFTPNTAIALRLGRALDAAVEEIFFIGDTEPESAMQKADLLLPGRAAQGVPVRLCRVNEKLVAVSSPSVPAYLPAADGVVDAASGNTVSVKIPAKLHESGKRLLIAGCDPALSLLTDLLAPSGIEIIGVPCSSRRALDWLKQGYVHAAGSHLLDHATGEYNVPIVNRLFRKNSVRMVTFASWEEGLVLPCGNPKAIRSIADLSRKDIVIVNREKGAGSRDLLDKGLRKARIAISAVRGYENLASGHLSAAHAVATGAADCCIANRSAARCLGLDFLPLALERFDLSFAKESLHLPAATAVLDALNRATLRNKLHAIAGYDTQHTGDVLI